jgi:hypothetical protein
MFGVDKRTSLLAVLIYAVKKFYSTGPELSLNGEKIRVTNSVKKLKPRQDKPLTSSLFKRANAIVLNNVEYVREAILW